MQDYLYLFIGADTSNRSAEQMEQIRKDWYGWMDDLRSAGVWVGGNPLDDTGRTISGSDKNVTDGPFAETKELVGGFIRVRTPDIETAVEHAKNCPCYAYGGRVEVRPVLEI